MPPSSYPRTPNHIPALRLPTSPTEEALSQCALFCSYYPPEQISRYSPLALHPDDYVLKGTITSLAATESGTYRANAALGRATAHDHLRILDGGSCEYGFTPPDDFAHGFGGIYTKYSPDDSVHVNVVFDNPRIGATPDIEHDRQIGSALAAQLLWVTRALGASIKHGTLPDNAPLAGLRPYHGSGQDPSTEQCVVNILDSRPRPK